MLAPSHLQRIRRRAAALVACGALVAVSASCAADGSSASGADDTTASTDADGAEAGLDSPGAATDDRSSMPDGSAADNDKRGDLDDLDEVATTPGTDVSTSSAGTDEPSTTVAPTTTAAATTTTVAGPTTTQPSGPFNRVPVEPTPSPLAAVGTNSGAETARIQQRLAQLGFWLASADGSYDLTTNQAVMAFQKYVGAPATGSVDAATAASLSNLDMRPYGQADSGTMLEVDKTRQLIFVLVDGRTRWVFNTSTGNDEPYREEDQNSPGEIVEDVAITPEGFHRVNRERPEGWWEGDLGQIYRPKYFVGGVAVHGSNSVPNYPASHGCVRVTTQAMDFIWEHGIMPLGLPVLVHGNPPDSAA